MEAPTFLSVIDKIISEFDTQYTTIESLQQIVLDLDSLSKATHQDKIDVLQRIIREYGKVNKRLTDKQSKKLLNLLIKYRDSFKPKENKPFISGNRFNKTAYYEKLPATYSEPVVIFDDSVISEVVYLLLTNLSRDTLSSSLNEFVLEYFDVIDAVLEGAPQRYYELTKIIKGILEDHGWKMGSGFQREPNQTSLVYTLDVVIKKYFF